MLTMSLASNQITRTQALYRQQGTLSGAKTAGRIMAIRAMLESLIQSFSHRQSYAAREGLGPLHDGLPETLKAEAFEPADGRSWSPKSAYLLRGLDLPGTLLRPANPGETGRKNPRQSDRESYTARMWFGPPGNRNFPDMCAGVIYFHPIKHLLVGFVAPHADFRMRMLDLKAATADFSDFTTLYPPYQALLDAKMANGGTAEEID